MKEDPNHPKAKAHMMRWGALRFGALDVDSRLESWDKMLRKYEEFSVRATDGSSPPKSGQGAGFPNEARADDQEMYEKYRSGGFGSKVTLDHFVKHAGHDQRPLNIKKHLKTLFFLKANK